MPYAHIDRSEWGALPPKHRTELPAYPASVVFIHHGASRTPNTEAKEATQWRGYMMYHRDVRGWSDIAYNFGVGPVSGNTYVGRGPRRQGGATGPPEDARSLSICAIGDFDSDEPTDELVNGIVKLIRRLIRNGHLTGPVRIKGHKDKPHPTACPGRRLYKQIADIERRANKPLTLEEETDNTGADLEDRVSALEDRVTDLEQQ